MIPENSVEDRDSKPKHERADHKSSRLKGEREPGWERILNRGLGRKPSLNGKEVSKQWALFVSGEE